MKNFRQASVFALLCLFAAGCASTQQAGVSPARFHEASAVNVELRFASWDYTFLVQPRYDEDGYLRQVRRDSIGQVFDQFNLRRDLAVVVIGWTYSVEDVKRLGTEWNSILGGCGFRRVVILRPNLHDKLNGSLIVDDTQLPISLAQASR